MKATSPRWRVEADESEAEKPCRCCGRTILLGSGVLVVDNDAVASYWYAWSEGHRGLFSLAVHWGPEPDARIVVCSCACDRSGTKLSLDDSATESWPELSQLGPILGRAEALADPDYPAFFDLFDAVIALEPRLGPRVAECERVA